MLGVIICLALIVSMGLGDVQAGSYTYVASDADEAVLQVKAQEDGITTAEALNRIIVSSLAQIALTLQAKQEVAMTDAAKSCAALKKVFVIDTSGKEATWTCNAPSPVSPPVTPSLAPAKAK